MRYLSKTNTLTNKIIINNIDDMWTGTKAKGVKA